MNPNITHTTVLILIMSVLTITMRVLPFFILGSKDKTPKWLAYLGDVLPRAIIGMLVIYCIRNMNLTAMPFGIPEIAACIITGIVHILKENTILSIICGTAAYMLFVQYIFPL